MGNAGKGLGDFVRHVSGLVLLGVSGEWHVVHVRFIAQYVENRGGEER